MMTKIRKECFIKIEMTEQQAKQLMRLFVSMQDRHFNEMTDMASCDPAEKQFVADSFVDLKNALESGIEKCRT